MRYLFVAFFMLGLVQCAHTGGYYTSSDSDRKFIEITTGDNTVAARQLANFLQENGYRILQQKDNIVVIKDNGSKYVLAAKVLGENELIDRIIVYANFSVKPDKKNTTALEKWVLELNSKFNIASFSLDKNSDLVIQTQISFIDRLYLRKISLFLKSFYTSVALALIQANAFQYLQ